MIIKTYDGDYCRDRHRSDGEAGIRRHAGAPMTMHGVGVARIIKLKPATGDPAINVAHSVKETIR